MTTPALKTLATRAATRVSTTLLTVALWRTASSPGAGPIEFAALPLLALTTGAAAAIAAAEFIGAVRGARARLGDALIVEVTALSHLIAFTTGAATSVATALLAGAIRGTGRLGHALMVEVTALGRGAEATVAATPIVTTLLPGAIGLTGRERLTHKGIGADELLRAEATDTTAPISTALLAGTIGLTAGGGDALTIDITNGPRRAGPAALTAFHIEARVSLWRVLDAGHHGDQPKERLRPANEPKQAAVHLRLHPEETVAQGVTDTLSVDGDVITARRRRSRREEHKDQEQGGE